MPSESDTVRLDKLSEIENLVWEGMGLIIGADEDSNDVDQSERKVERQLNIVWLCQQLRNQILGGKDKKDKDK